MADEIVFDYGTTGIPVYAVILNSAGLVWNGATFETINVANWSTYAVTMTEASGSGIYLGSFPVISAGEYNVNIYTMAGVSPASTDPILGNGVMEWGGTSEEIIVNGCYCTLQNFKDYHNLTSTDVTDDGVINLMIESASRRIDTETGRKFYQTTSTKYFDTPRKQSSLLIFDEDCISVSGMTNGNGADFNASDYVLYPYEGPPYDSLGLVDNPSMVWLPTPYGNKQQAITVVGTWGSASVPTDIQDACMMIVVQEYHRRYGEAGGQDSVVMPSGMVISFGKMPLLVAQILANHRKIGMA